MLSYKFILTQHVTCEEFVHCVRQEGLHSNNFGILQHKIECDELFYPNAFPLTVKQEMQD